MDVSSEFSDAFAAGNAIDGDLSTAWSTAGDGDDASITVDLGGPADIVGVRLRSRQTSDCAALACGHVTEDHPRRILRYHWRNDRQDTSRPDRPRPVDAHR